MYRWYWGLGVSRLLSPADGGDANISREERRTSHDSGPRTWSRMSNNTGEPIILLTMTNNANTIVCVTFSLDCNLKWTATWWGCRQNTIWCQHGDETDFPKSCFRKDLLYCSTTTTILLLILGLAHAAGLTLLEKEEKTITMANDEEIDKLYAACHVP